MNCMLNIPFIVQMYVLQQYAASQKKMPFATLEDKVKAHSNYINLQSQYN